MDVVARSRFVRISPTKISDVAASIRGLAVAEALKIVQFNPRKGAFLIRKTLKSAIANAENNSKLSAENLKVKEAAVEQGPALKRFRARARGGASPIRKRMSHIRIVLTDGNE